MKIKLRVHPISEGLPNEDGFYLVWYKGAEYPSEVMFGTSPYISDHPCFFDDVLDEYGAFKGQSEILAEKLAYWSERPKIPKEVTV